MTSVDLIEAITGSEEDNLKTAFKHMVTRIIIIFILFLLPVILGRNNTNWRRWKSIL